MTYPDITLISSICEALHITEHELITAKRGSASKRTGEAGAEISAHQTGVIAIIMLALYGLSLLICFICNLAIQHTLSWFFIVLASERSPFL